MTPPTCRCGKPLDRIDHLGIEHTILRDGVYEPVSVTEGLDGRAGLASEVALRCGYCGRDIEPEDRRFFYQRWRQLLQYQEKDGLT